MTEYKVAEFVSNAHPDRICDTIVAKVVQEVQKKDGKAMCALECAIYRNHVFLDGRIASYKYKKIIKEDRIREIIVDTLKEFNFIGTNENGRLLDELEILLRVDIDSISNEYRLDRNVADDQAIVCGYAENNQWTSYLPMEQFLVLTIGNDIINQLKMTDKVSNARINPGLGPDFKLLAILKYEKDRDHYSFEKVIVSIQNEKDMIYDDIFNHVKRMIDNSLSQAFKDHHQELRFVPPLALSVNHFGSFEYGGPLGDNGLSGKKLAVDFYGPSIPIGGGAIYGKDRYKVDHVGAMMARKLALNLVKEKGYEKVFTRLTFEPGEKEPCLVEAYSIEKNGAVNPIPRKDYRSWLLMFRISRFVKNYENILTKKNNDLMKGFLITEK